MMSGVLLARSSRASTTTMMMNRVSVMMTMKSSEMFIQPRRSIYTPSAATTKLVEREDRVCAHTYHPLPVVLSRGRGSRVWDVDNKGLFGGLFFYFFLFFFFFFFFFLNNQFKNIFRIF
jgi:hypothetical protein